MSSIRRAETVSAIFNVLRIGVKRMKPWRREDVNGLKFLMLPSNTVGATMFFHHWPAESAHLRFRPFRIRRVESREWAAPNPTTSRYSQNEVFLSVIVSKKGRQVDRIGLPSFSCNNFKRSRIVSVKHVCPNPAIKNRKRNRYS